MNYEHQNHDRLPSSEPSGLTSSDRPVRLFNFFERTYASTSLIFLSSILEIFLGLSVIFASMMGLINPMWLSISLLMLASLACVIGTFLLYDITHKNRGAKELVRSAMHRIMNAQN